MNQIYVSVIIPVYNVEKYLVQCIDSIINQTLNNIEIFAIDDGSIDSSLDILNSYKSIDPRITVISIENSKQGKCRNLAIDLAQGKYIFFIDSDDYIKENTLEILYKEIEKDKNEIVIYNGRSFYDESNVISKNNYFNIDNTLENTTMDGIEFSKHGISFISPCMKLYNRDFLIKNKIKFAEGVYGEDDIFWYKCCLASKKIKYIDRVLYFRRIRSNSVMTSRNISSTMDRLGNIIEINNLLKKYNTEKIIYFYNHLSKSTLELMKDIIIFRSIIKKEEVITINSKYYKEVIFKNKLGMSYNAKAFIIIYLPIIYKILLRIKEKNVNIYNNSNLVN